MKLTWCLLPFILIVSISARTAEEWKTRTMYQLLTDRFASTGDEVPKCSNLFEYCGGTFKGIEKNLDYIQGLGINAIWISPVWQNGPKGYHGYWVKNFYELNENFGTKQDLKDLIEACHARDIWVMVDVVPNHVMPLPDSVNVTETIDFSAIYPFNDPSHYHLPVVECINIPDQTNQTDLESCWLWKLPDLNHENPDVAKMLLDWIKDFIETYKVDGLRLDALKHAPRWFWEEFSKAAGVYTLGEFFNGDIKSCAQYQGPIDSLLNFPLHYHLDRVFHKGENMTQLSEYYEEAATGWVDYTVLVNFVNNHDLSRFLFNNSDIPGFKASYAFVLSSMGIPSVYYGDEQLFSGGADPENREPLWGNMSTKSQMYEHIKIINTFRQKTEFYKYDQIERISDETFYAFSRGKYFFAFTNSLEEQGRTVKNHSYEDGTVLCNAFEVDDCVEVKNGEFGVKILDKQVKILFPKEVESIIA